MAFRVIAIRWPMLISLVVALAAAAIATTAVLAQSSGTTTVRFTIAEAYGIVAPSSITLDGEADSDIPASKTYAGTSNDYLFRIKGPSTAETKTVEMQVSIESIPNGWTYDVSGDSPGKDKLRLVYRATKPQFNNKLEISDKVIPTSYAVTVFSGGGSVPSVPVGYYGGTLEAALGQRENGQAGEVELTLTISVTAK